MRIVGYDTFISLLKAVYGLRLAGVPSAHVLVVSPPGTGKTTIAKLFAKAVGASYVRTTGRYDMLPEDFVAEKEIVYDGGNPKIVWRLRAVGKLLASENAKPGIWFFDEFDKMNRKSMMALLELMEEQQVTLPNGETHKLNFLLIAAGNSRKYDRDASPIPRSVRDRFAVYWELGYLPVNLEVEVLEQGVNSMLGLDVSPSEQFSFVFDRPAFEKNLSVVKKRYGECFVRAVSYLRTHKLVEEPPGPRAYIHATLVASSLATVSPMSLGEAARLAFVSSVSGKITVPADASPFEVCEEAFEAKCTTSEEEEETVTTSAADKTEPSEGRPSTSAKVRSLLEKGSRTKGGGSRGTSTYSLADVARYLSSIDRIVFTSAGSMPAGVAGKLVLSGSIKEVVVPGGPTIRIVGDHAVSTQPLPSVGREEAELTYSKREIDLVRLADLLAHAGLDTVSLSPYSLTDPGEILSRAFDVLSSKRDSPLYRQLRSSLANLVEIVGDVVYSREGDNTDALSSYIARLSKVGEFEELTEHEKHKLHVTRTMLRVASGNPKEVYKSFAEIGRRYVILFDRSGSMSETYAGGATKKAIGALVTALIAKSDPEARFNLVVFDTSAKIVARDCDHIRIIDELAELEPRGGTHYSSALLAASSLMDEGDILVIVGDFMDTSSPTLDVVERIRSKVSSVVLVPVGNANVEYATYLAKRLGGRIYVYKGGVFTAIPAVA